MKPNNTADYIYHSLFSVIIYYIFADVSKYVSMRVKVVIIKKDKLVIRLTLDGKRQYKSLKSGITVQQWDLKKNQLKGVRPAKTEKYSEYLENKKFIKDVEEKYTNQINKLLNIGKPFTMVKVFDMVENPPQVNTTVFEVFDAWIKEMDKAERYGSRDVAKGILSRFKGYHEKDLYFYEMDKEFLLKYKAFLLKDGLKPVSVSIHLRTFRTLFNMVIKQKVISRDSYPYEDGEIMQLASTGRNAKALRKTDVDAIRLHMKTKLEPDTDKWHACNYFIFGYIGRGINFTDIARLKWTDYEHGVVTFVRHKTRSKVQETIKFTATTELKTILSWYHKQRQLHNPYIFPILTAYHNTEARKHNRISKMRKQVNKDLKEVGVELEFPIKLTTYVWRHTFATVAKNTLGVPIPMISEMLGHHDLATTEAYLKQFDDKDKDKAVIGL